MCRSHLGQRKTLLLLGRHARTARKRALVLADETENEPGRSERDLTTGQPWKMNTIVSRDQLTSALRPF